MLVDSFIFAANITLPISLIICLGIVLKRMKMINNEFADMGSALVFNLTLPCLLFVNIVEYDFGQDLPFEMVVFGCVFTTLTFLALVLMARFTVADKASRGVFVQGSFRSNLGIIGLAYVLDAFGQDVLALASLYLAFVTILYNAYSVVILNYYAHGEMRLRSLGWKLVSNPLILSISAALLLAYWNVALPEVMLDTGHYFARMTLPLALLCAGASIRWREFRSSPTLYLVVLMKLIVLPLLAALVAYSLGWRDHELGIIYLMTAAPSAAAGYAMVKVIGGNAHLAAAVVAATTLASIVTTTLGLFILRSAGLI